MTRTLMSKFLGFFGLASAAALASAEACLAQAATERDAIAKAHERLRGACMPVAVWAVETANDEDTRDWRTFTQPWFSDYYLVDGQQLDFRILRGIGRAVFSDYELRTLGVAATAPAYQKWFAEHPREAAEWKRLPHYDRDRATKRAVAAAA